MATDESWPPRGMSRLWAMADLVTPMAIRVAATLDLVGHVTRGATSLESLAERAGVPATTLGRLMGHLVNVGLFAETAPGEYRCTELGEQLRDGAPGDPREWLRIDGSFGRGDLALVRLLDVVHTGEPAYEAVYGRDFWADLGATPSLSESFDTLMACLLPPSETAALAQGYDWDAVEHVVDVGGGDATLLVALLQAHPHLRGTLVELEGPATAARKALRDAGLADRCAIVVGSFFDPLPDDGDAYVLSVVLHDWDDAPATDILRRCAEAAGDTGRVLLVEGLRDNPVAPTARTALDLRMLTYFGGKERTAAELAEIGAAAGLRLKSTRDVTFYRSVLEMVAA